MISGALYPPTPAHTASPQAKKLRRTSGAQRGLEDPLLGHPEPVCICVIWGWPYKVHPSPNHDLRLVTAPQIQLLNQQVFIRTASHGLAASQLMEAACGTPSMSLLLEDQELDSWISEGPSCFQVS